MTSLIRLNSESKFWFDNGRTAHGAEPKPNKKGRDPHSSLASKSRSGQAWLIDSARGGNTKALRLITKHLAGMIAAHAEANNWKNQGDYDGFAAVILTPYVFDSVLSVRASAIFIGVSPTAYVEHWRPKIVEVERWVKQWVSE